MPPSQDHHSGPHTPNACRAGAVLAGGLCLAAAVAIWALITGTFDDTSERVLLSAAAAAVATLGGLAGATVLGHDENRDALGQVTIGISSVALTLAVLLIWIPDVDHSDVIARAFGISLTTMIACAHASLMHSRARVDDGDAVRALTRIAVGAASIAALLIGCVLLLATSDIGSGIWRGFGVLVVIAVLTTLLAPLARRMTPNRNAPGPADASPTSEPSRRDSDAQPPSRFLTLGHHPAG